MEEENNLPRKESYRIELVETLEEKGSIPLIEREEVVAHYNVRGLVSQSDLVSYYGSQEVFKKVIQAGLAHAQAMYWTTKLVSPKITIVPMKEDPGALEVVVEIPGKESYIVNDGAWRND